MQSFNKIILVGRLTADPEVRYAPSGNAVATFRMAVNRRPRTSPTGERVEETDFFRVVVFSQRLVDFVSSYLTKGRLVLVEGEMRMNRWKNELGESRTSYEVVAFNVNPLDRKPREESLEEEIDLNEVLGDEEDSSNDEPPY